MNNQTTEKTNMLNLGDYLEDLMEDIGFGKASESEKEQMYKGLSNEVKQIILNSVADLVEGEEIDEALALSEDLKSFEQFIEQLIELSPGIQLGIVEALDQFYQETVDAYQLFSSN